MPCHKTIREPRIYLIEFTLRYAAITLELVFTSSHIALLLIFHVAIFLFQMSAAMSIIVLIGFLDSFKQMSFTFLADTGA